MVDKYIWEAFCGGKEHLPQVEQAMFKKGMKAILDQPLVRKEAWMLSIRVVTV